MKQTSNILILFCAVSLFSACSLMDNRMKLAKDSLETQINQESRGAIKLIDFKKTDGVERNEQGVNLYSMDFKATIQYQEECYKNAGGLGGWLYSDFGVSQRPPQGWDSYLQGQGARYNKDAKVILTGVAEYEKKESGWNLSGLRIMRSDNEKN